MASSYSQSEIYKKWVPWTCYKRLDSLSRTIMQEMFDEHKQVFLIDEEMFQFGMAMEAVCAIVDSGEKFPDVR